MATHLDSYQFPGFIVLEHVVPMLCIIAIIIFLIRREYLKKMRGAQKITLSNNRHPSLYRRVAESIALRNSLPNTAPLYTPTNPPGHSTSSQSPVSSLSSQGSSTSTKKTLV